MLISIVSSIFVVFAGIASSTTTNYFDLDTQQFTFNQSKNIFIATSIGGSSVSSYASDDSPTDTFCSIQNGFLKLEESWLTEATI